jgi:hypothetical protein
VVEDGAHHLAGNGVRDAAHGIGQEDLLGEAARMVIVHCSAARYVRRRRVVSRLAREGRRKRYSPAGIPPMLVRKGTRPNPMPLETKLRKSVIGTIWTSALAAWLAAAGCSVDLSKLRPNHKDGSVPVVDAGGNITVADAGSPANDAMTSDNASAGDLASTTVEAGQGTTPATDVGGQAADGSGPPNDAVFLADLHDLDAAGDGGPSQDGAPLVEAGSVVEVGGTGGTTLLDAGTDLRRDLGPDSGPDAPPDLAVDSVDAIPLPTGLVAYYPCESANGVVLPDQSGNGNDATLSIGLPPGGGTAPSGYQFEAGKVGNALTLLQAGEGYVSMPPSIFNGATAVTVAFWIKVNTAQNWQRAFDIGVNAHLDMDPYTGSKYFFLTPQNAASQIEIATTANGFSKEQLLYANAIVPADGWRHVAVTIDGSQGVVYVNGPDITGTTTKSNTLTLRPVDLGTIDYAYLGKSPWSVDPYLDGQIDEVRVYRRALSAAEVHTLAQFTGP